MGILKKSAPGVLLTAEFRKGGKGLSAELKAYELELARLQKTEGFSHFVQATEEKDGVLIVSILRAEVRTKDKAVARGKK